MRSNEQLKQLNRQVWSWTKKVRQPFSGEVSQVGQDSATDPTKALVHALVKQLKEEPEEKPSLDVKTPANVKRPKPRNVLTPKPTPTPRRPLRPLVQQGGKVSQVMIQVSLLGQQNAIELDVELLDQRVGKIVDDGAVVGLGGIGDFSR